MMPAGDPMRRLCLGKLRNIPAQILCILLVLLQAFLINHHIVVTSRPMNMSLWAWFAGDAVVITAFAVGFYMREWRLGIVAKRHKESTGFVKGLPFASLSWLVYGLLLGTRIALLFKNDLQDGGEIAGLKVTICLTAIVCVFFTIAHHHNHESLARREAILSLVKMFMIDLLDTVDLLDVLFLTAKENVGDFPVVLEDIVLAIVTLNLIRPTIVLLSLFVDHFGSSKKSLKVKILKTLVELLLLNVPLLCIRVYISVRYNDSISVFLVKNILGGVFSVIEIYDCCYDIRTEEKESDQSKEQSKDQSKDQSGNINNGLDSTDIEMRGYRNQVSI